MKILIAEDDFTSRLLLLTLLKNYGPLDIAVNGKEAVEAARVALEAGKPYDLICLDIMMPEMDGLTLAREVKADPRLSGIPLVLLTSIPPHVGDAVNGDEFAACLTKPLRQAALLEALTTVVAAQRPGARRRNVAPFRPRRPSGA